MTLTDKQKMFCKEYIVNLNATQAAIKAGYSKKTATETGYENLRKPHVQKEIQQLMNKRAKNAEISAQNVLESILEIRETCTAKVELVSKTGDILGETIVDVNGALKANEMLGKHLKLFTDRVESTNHNFNKEMTEEEAEEILKSANIDPEEV